MTDLHGDLSSMEFLEQLKAELERGASTAGLMEVAEPSEEEVRAAVAEAAAELLEALPVDRDEPSADADLDEPAAKREKARRPSPGDDDDDERELTPGRGSVTGPRPFSLPEAVRNDSQLAELFERVNNLLGGSRAEVGEFRPQVPESLEETGLIAEDIERLALKYLLSKGAASGRQICHQLRLPFGIVEPRLKEWKNEQLIAYKGAAEVGDYVFTITDKGRDRAKRYNDECSYFGSAPVALEDYLKAMSAQSIAKQNATETDLKRAFADLLIRDSILDRLGPAVNSGRGMFLFGEPGNGKTSIAERVTIAFGSSIWIPRTLGIDGDIIRLFDPGVHQVVDVPVEGEGLFDLSGIDQRWVCIVRPTIVAGGELTMDELEVTQNPQTKICEAPLQLKSNCGTLVIDDFGRQTMPVDVLLNRWIVPLEKRYDFLNLPSGKKIQVPFDQLIIFSTNLEPKDLVDGAFLRRIPYKIEVGDPSEEHFRKLFEIMAPKLGLLLDHEAVDYLIETHYKGVGRPFRACQPRDLLLQIRNYCIYKGLEKRVTNAGFDFAVSIYFSVM